MASEIALSVPARVQSEDGSQARGSATEQSFSSSQEPDTTTTP